MLNEKGSLSLKFLKVSMSLEAISPLLVLESWLGQHLEGEIPLLLLELISLIGVEMTESRLECTGEVYPASLTVKGPSIVSSFLLMS